jgi:hypothetical protein
MEFIFIKKVSLASVEMSRIMSGFELLLCGPFIPRMTMKFTCSHANLKLSEDPTLQLDRLDSKGKDLIGFHFGLNREPA